MWLVPGCEESDLETRNRAEPPKRIDLGSVFTSFGFFLVNHG